jgi:lipoate-protein ligase A
MMQRSPVQQLYPDGVEQRWRAYDWEIIPPVALEPAMNLALDEVLTQQVGSARQRPLLRFWGWAAPCVVIGRFQSVSNEVRVERARELGIQVVRRISGGGAMLIEPESAITYSLYLPPEMVDGMSFPESYAFLDGWVVDALRDLGIDAWYEPLNDITSSGGKIGGAAQARRFGAVLHHTTMAYDMTQGLLTEVLRIGLEKLRDKGIRSAEARVGPLRRQTNMARDEIIAHLHEAFIARTAAVPARLADEDVARARTLVNEKFGADDWTYILP